MGWTWDEDKNRANVRKHGLSFETAQLVFDDPLALSRRDSYPDEVRWQTIGAIGNVVIIIVHTWQEENYEGRIISARKATSHERKEYEDDEFS